ncbi:MULTISPECIES: DUF7503 family protein [unclassified Haloparvum]
MRQKVADYLANHPKMTGVLFMAMLLLSQAAPAAANMEGATAGP